MSQESVIKNIVDEQVRILEDAVIEQRRRIEELEAEVVKLQVQLEGIGPWIEGMVTSAGLIRFGLKRVAGTNDKEVR